VLLWLAAQSPQAAPGAERCDAALGQQAEAERDPMLPFLRRIAFPQAPRRRLGEATDSTEGGNGMERPRRQPPMSGAPLPMLKDQLFIYDAWRGAKIAHAGGRRPEGPDFSYSKYEDYEADDQIRKEITEPDEAWAWRL
jgi:hypothetical protein